MKKALNSYWDAENGRVNISPMIDMVFILLIFFVVTAVFVEDWGFEANTPTGEIHCTEKSYYPLHFLLDESNRIYLEDSQISLETVRTKVSQRLMMDPELSVSVHAQARANAGLLVQVLDEARLGGAEILSVSLDQNY